MANPTTMVMLSLKCDDLYKTDEVSCGGLHKVAWSQKSFVLTDNGKHMQETEVRPVNTTDESC